jgi:hypothetical protein
MHNTVCATCLLGEKDLSLDTIYCPLHKEHMKDEDSCQEWVGYDSYKRVVRKPYKPTKM